MRFGRFCCSSAVNLARAVAVTATAFVVQLAVPIVAAAQFAGVPPRPPRPPAPAVVVAPRDSASAIQRARDSVVLVQRLDIQAWVDSAAPALARRPSAEPPRPDSSRRVDSARARRPESAAAPRPAGTLAVRHSAAPRTPLSRREASARPWPSRARRFRSA